MIMVRRIGVALVLGLGSGEAIAEHDHGAAAMHADGSVTAGVALVAAQFETMSYGGDYQGVIPSLAWARGRFGASASLAMYRLQSNGLTQFGVGDVMAGGHAMLATGHNASAGVALMMMAPTGRSRQGFGMGHVMAMPSLFASYHAHPMMFAGAVGFARALTAETAHQHGPWPLVDPMNVSEVTWSASSDLAIAHTRTRMLSAGARVSGAVPVGEPGSTRVIGGLRVAWAAGKVSTGVELQGALVGEPFRVRGMLETTVSF